MGDFALRLSIVGRVEPVQFILHDAEVVAVVERIPEEDIGTIVVAGASRAEILADRTLLRTAAVGAIGLMIRNNPAAFIGWFDPSSWAILPGQIQLVELVDLDMLPEPTPESTPYRSSGLGFGARG